MAEVSENKQGLKDLISSFTQSHIIIGQRIEKSSEYPHGFKHVDTIPPEETALLFLGGNGTMLEEKNEEDTLVDKWKSYFGKARETGDKSANGYLSQVEKSLGNLKESELKDVLQQLGKDTELKKAIGLYSVIYDFGKDEEDHDISDKNSARVKLYADHGQFLSSNKKNVKEWVAKLNEETKDPNYVDELFDKVFLSRICDENGEKLPVEKACERMRNLTVCAHCHGAYTFLKVEEKIWQKMQQLGYSNEERAKIQSQLLCVAIAPDAPLGVSKSKMISFASAEDAKINGGGGIGQYNNFKMVIFCGKRSKRINKFKKALFNMSYLPDKRGEVFLVENAYEIEEFVNTKEHDFSLSSKDSSLTEDGKQLYKLALRTVCNGIIGSLKKEPLTTTEDLICGQDEQMKADFQRYKVNGESLWTMVKDTLVLGLPARNKQENR